MTTSIIIGRKHKQTGFKVVEGPGLPEEVNKKFNQMTLTAGSIYAEIYLHELMLTAGRKSKVFPMPR